MSGSEVGSAVTQISGEAKGFRGLLRVAALTLLSVALFFVVRYPSWCNEFLYSGGLIRASYWKILFGLLGGAIPYVASVAASVLLTLWVIRRRSEPLSLKSFASYVSGLLRGRAGFVVQWVLVFLFSVAFGTVPIRAGRGLPVRAEVVFPTDSLSSLFGESRSYVFLSESDINELFGSFEPELLPGSVTREEKGGRSEAIGLESDPLRASVEVTRETTTKVEYQRSSKSSVRKLSAVVDLLYRRGEVFVIDGVFPAVEELDGAARLLARHKVGYDRSAFEGVRREILGREEGKMVGRLKDLKGRLVIIRASWTVAVEEDGYKLSHVLAKELADAPVCRLEVKKDKVEAHFQSVLGQLRGGAIDLTVLGWVTMGDTRDRRLLWVRPIAAFHGIR